MENTLKLICVIYCIQSWVEIWIYIWKKKIHILFHDKIIDLIQDNQSIEKHNLKMTDNNTITISSTIPNTS